MLIVQSNQQSFMIVVALNDRLTWDLLTNYLIAENRSRNFSFSHIPPPSWTLFACTKAVPFCIARGCVDGYFLPRTLYCPRPEQSFAKFIWVSLFVFNRSTLCYAHTRDGRTEPNLSSSYRCPRLCEWDETKRPALLGIGRRKPWIWLCPPTMMEERSSSDIVAKSYTFRETLSSTYCIRYQIQIVLACCMMTASISVPWLW